MKYAIGIGILIVGLGVGYIIGVNTASNDESENEPTTEFITETIHDTIIHKETIKVPVTKEEIDTADVLIDSTMMNIDTLPDIVEDTIEDISIRRERMIGSQWLKVNVIKDFEDNDSLLKEMLGIQDKLPNKMLVEFWESPLHFSGYKLSRSKLILYGMPTGLDYKFYRKKNEYYLSAQTFYYSLKETAEFLPYLEVSKDAVFND